MANQAGAADAPEYIASQTPAGTPLDAVRSPTDTIGIRPDAPDLLLPGQIIPQLHAKIFDTGISFIDESILTVSPRVYYRYNDNDDGSISEAFAGGGAAVFETGWIRGFARVGLAGYTSLKLCGPEDRDGSGLLAEDQESYAVLGQLYAEFQRKKTSATVGRSLIDLPYINANDSRMTPNTFEYLGVRSTELKNLQIGLGHVRKIRYRNEKSFQSMSERAGASGTDKGVSLTGIRWNPTEDLYFAAVEQYGWDTFNTLYFESERLLRIQNGFILKIGAQFTDQRSVGDELIGDFETHHLGLKSSLGRGGFTASSSFTWTSEKAAIQKPWGGSPSYNSLMISDFDRPGEKSLRFGAGFDFTEVGFRGLSASSYFAYGSAPDESPDQREHGITVDYKEIGGRFKNLWLRGRAAWNNRGEGTTRADYRIILNYSFSF